MRFSNLADWLRWQEQHHPSAIDLGLDRVRTVGQRLDLLHSRHRTVITVAGTNGKGSAVATLESLILDGGATVGTYTSPHLHRYNERIKVGGQEVEDSLICRAFAAIDAQAQDVSLTYFEFGTLAALWVFNALQLRYWVLEVGLGGRLDAVNIVDADVAIITSIALDHQDWLGTDLRSIGREKAGIFRPGQMAVYTDRQIEPSVLEVAQALGTDVQVQGRDYQVVSEGAACRVVMRGAEVIHFARPQLPLPSVAAALVAAAKLAVPMSARWLSHTLPALRVAGRFEQREFAGRHLILDVAHNPAASTFFLERLAEQAQTLPRKDAEVHVVIAMMADKDIAGVVQVLAPAVDHWHPAELPGNARAASAEQLVRLLPPNTVVYPSVDDALVAALRVSNPGDSIWILGSFFTVSAAHDWLARNPQFQQLDQ